jgi:hypothetical protein
MKVSFKEYKEARALQDGYIVGESAKGALYLARVKKKSEALDLVIRWEAECDTWLDFIGDTLPETTWERRFDSGHWEVQSVVVEDRDGEVLASLGGIILKTTAESFERDRESYELEVLAEAVEHFEEVPEYELEEQYCEMLDDVYGETNIAGYQYSTSRALAEVDPVAFRCGFADYIDSLITDGDMVEACGKYYRKG